MHKSVQKVPKVLTFRKSVPKFSKDPKIWEEGGVRPVLDEVQIKAAFFLELPKALTHGRFMLQFTGAAISE